MAREMKDSGIEWIGEIPKEWLVKKMKHGFTIFAGATPKSEKSEYWNGEISWITPADYKTKDKYVYTGRKNISMEGYKSCGTTIVPKGSIIFSKRAPVGTVAISGNELCTNQGCLACVPLNMIDSIYYYYVISVFTEQFELVSSGTTFKEISANAFANFPLPCPIYEEQIKISSFLGKKCAELNNVLEKTRASIEEYKKLKQAVITHAVTKGIRDNREMKDSGIEWNSRIPVEWNSINPKALFRQRKDKAFESEQQLTASQQYGIMYQSDYMELTGTKVVTVEKDFDILKHVEAGDFVISMRSFQGGLEYSELSGSISSAYVMLVPNLELVYPRFYRWLLKSEVYITALQSTSNMVRDGQAMRYSNFSQVRLYIVPMEEQKEIARYLDEKCAVINELIAKKEQYLSEIENYKKSLIYEYVTGKKEVPQNC